MSRGHLNSGISEVDIESCSFKERIAANDLDAFRQLFKTLHPELYGYGIKFCGNSDLVKDQIQEVFLNLWERGESAGKIHSLKTYLLISLRRALLKQLDKERPYKTIANSKQADYFEFSAAELIIKEEHYRQQHAKLTEALNELSPRLREVIYLKYYNGLSYEEMEQVLGISYQSIRNNIHRALTKLREMLGNSISEMLFCLFLITKGIF